MPLANHINPDHFLDLDREQSISREEGLAAWEQAYTRLGEALHALGGAATLYVVFGLQGGGKSTWVAGNAPHLGEQAVFFDGPLPSRRHRQRALAIASEVGCRAVAVWVNTPLAVARARNTSRRGLARIKDETLMHVFESLEPPSLDEGFSEIIEVVPRPPLNPD